MARTEWQLLKYQGINHALSMRLSSQNDLKSRMKPALSSSESTPKKPAAPWWKLPSPRLITGIKCALFCIALLPFARLVYLTLNDGLGANPTEFITRSTGWWTLFLLCVTLCVTPARTLLGLPWLVRLRRMLGLFTFFYVCLHLLTYLWFDRQWDFSDLAADIIKRPFITVGFAAFVLLIPLAATSFNAAIKWMTARRWQTLHKLIYVIAPLGVLHFWWHKAGKNLWVEPLIFAAAVVMLLGWRVWQRSRM
jgi:sulfoxide reductase heme-binding subunit YedZ